jgi:hypothetical protein
MTYVLLGIVTLVVFLLIPGSLSAPARRATHKKNGIEKPSKNMTAKHRM